MRKLGEPLSVPGNVEYSDDAFLSDVSKMSADWHVSAFELLDYDDDEAYARIHRAMTEKYPDFKTYMMRLVDDYLDFSEDYLESIGAIDWE